MLKGRENGGWHSRSRTLSTQGSRRAPPRQPAPRHAVPRPLPRQAAKETGFCAVRSPTGAECGVRSQQWRKAVSTGCQAARLQHALHTGFCGRLPFGQSSSEGQFGTEEYFKLPSTFRAVTILFFVEVSGGFGSHGLHLALNWWLIPVVSMETGIGRDKYREL